MGTERSLAQRVIQRKVGSEKHVVGRIHHALIPRFVCFDSLFTVFVCVAALAILDRLDEVNSEMLCWWLAERQLPNGGLNGRPEKLPDVSAAAKFLGGFD